MYPAIEKVLRYRMAPLRRMTGGMFRASASFAVVALAQHRLDAGETVHIGWQLLAYLIITTAEVMVSITGLEFAYTQAPRRMKSLIIGFWLLAVSSGNILVALLARFEDLPRAQSFWTFAGLMVLAAGIFGLRAAFYQYKTLDHARVGGGVMGAAWLHVRQAPLPSRLGCMVAGVLVALMEVMDLASALTQPDRAVLVTRLEPWPQVHNIVGQLVAGIEPACWWLRGSVLVIAALGGLMAARYARRLAATLARLRDAARDVASGDLDTPIHIQGAREIEGLARSIDDMRVGLRDVLRLAGETAALRQDVALGQPAGALLAPTRGWVDQEQGDQLTGFHAANGQRVGFWWHENAPGNRRHAVLGYVECTGPAAVMSLAALAGAVRDELLHVADVDIQALVSRAYALCSTLTRCPLGLCVVTLAPSRGHGQWASAGAHPPSFAFHDDVRTALHDGHRDLRAGEVTYTARVAVMFGPRRGTDGDIALRQALDQATRSDAPAPDVGALLEGDHMPAAVVTLQRAAVSQARVASRQPSNVGRAPDCSETP